MNRRILLTPRVVKLAQGHTRHDIHLLRTNQLGHTGGLRERIAMSVPSTQKQPQQRNPAVSATPGKKKAKLAAKRAANQQKQETRNAFMERLENELQEFLQSSTIPPVVVQRRHDTSFVVERALQAHFGPHVRVQNVGLDRFGISILFAPLELAIVDTRNKENDSLPDPSDQLYDPIEVEAALKKAGIPVELYTPPSWISSETARKPFVLPEAVVLSYKLEFVVLPPNPSHNARINLVQQCLERYPSMKNMLALLFFLVATGCHTHLPPMTTTVLVHIAMAYYRQAYKETSPVPPSASAPGDPHRKGNFSFYYHPSDIIYPNGSPRASSSINGPIKFNYTTSSSDMHPKREPQSVTYHLLELIRWWDGIRWDEDIINPTKQQPDPRNLDAKSDIHPRPWDENHSTLVVTDPVNPLNNLATLVTPLQYAEMRRSCRVAHRRLVDGTPFALARRLTRPLLHDPMSLPIRVYGTQTSKDYGEYLTGEMEHLYQATRPSPEVIRRRQTTLNHLKYIIQKRYGNRFEPALFGSSRYGVGDNGSDLDIVILDRQLERGFEPHIKKKDLHEIYRLRPLSERMRHKFDKITLIEGAKVPIIKARDMASQLSVDININDRLGLYNTELLSHYCALWPPLSNLIYVVKKWAKSRDLNDSAGLKRSGGPSFSSYCISLMVIGFLQTHGILPNLQDRKYLSRLSPELQSHPDIFWLRHSDKWRMKTYVEWFPLPVHEWRPLNYPPLGRVFYSWMMYFAYDHQYSDFAIRISEGGIVPRLTRKKQVGKRKHASRNQVAPIADENSDEEAEEEEEESAQHPEAADEQLVEAITNDLSTLEFQKAAAQAKNMQEEAQELEEVFEEYEVERTSQLTEPERWRTDQFVVADPFIFEKNCAGSVTKRKIQDFILECQDTVRRMDSGEDLQKILSGGLPVTRGPKGTRGKRASEPFVDPKMLKALAPPGSSQRRERKVLKPLEDKPIIIVPKVAQGATPHPQAHADHGERPGQNLTGPNPSQ